MKTYILMALAIFGSLMVKAETFNVEVGGNQNVTPYYEPQFLSINIGDTIIWDFVLGTHNVTSTSGPEMFDSGDLSSPNTFMHVFTLAGTYDYECTLFNHADTQFGTITVSGPDGVAETAGLNLSIYPNPAIDYVKIELEGIGEIEGVDLVNASGIKVQNVGWDKVTNTLVLDELANGMYILSVNTSKGIIRKTIKVEK